jgi:phosphoribosylformylglycinamidine synthase
VKATVTVRFRPGVHDPQGEAVCSALVGLGFAGVRSTRIGKVVELELDTASEAQARTQVEDMCRRLLANPVLEEYEVRLELEPERPR